MSNKDSTSMLSWFGRRREGAVGDGTRTMALPIGDCVAELVSAIRATRECDASAAKKAVDRIVMSERGADYKEDELCNQLSMGEMSGPEREDFMHFVRKLDKIAYWCKEAAVSVSLMNDIGMKVPRDDMDLLIQAVTDLDSEFKDLTNALNMVGVEGSDVMTCVQGVREMERAVDRSCYAVTKSAFSNPDMDIKTCVMVARLADAIENAADTAKSCSDTVALLNNAKRIRSRG